MKSIAIILLSVVLHPSLVHGAKPQTHQKESEVYIEFGFPVAYPPNSSVKVKQLAKKLGRELNILSYESKISPGCCLWLENEDWKPNPSQDGYIILIQPGGGKITATDERQLELAIKLLLKLCKKEGSKTLIPVGLITNYPIVDTTFANQ